MITDEYNVVDPDDMTQSEINDIMKSIKKSFMRVVWILCSIVILIVLILYLPQIRLGQTSIDVSQVEQTLYADILKEANNLVTKKLQPVENSTINVSVYKFEPITTSPLHTQSSNINKNLRDKLKELLKCNNRDYASRIEQRGRFWVLRNYIRADHGPLSCYESITYTTHADITFLDNLIPLLERWRGPISVALYAPGTDFKDALNSMRYLRDCESNSELVKKFVTFHIYFESLHFPKMLPKSDDALSYTYYFNCSLPAPYLKKNHSSLYKSKQRLLYPINIGRNIAREAALTHFILSSDIELYPSPNLIENFLEMIARNYHLLDAGSRVYPINIFEVQQGQEIPKDKRTLKMMIDQNLATSFHKKVCPLCHEIPGLEFWFRNNRVKELNIFAIAKRLDELSHWEPIFIGTHNDPLYDENFSWEGKRDKMSQSYAMCVLDYDFFVLDNAFLVHRPGIKLYKKDGRRLALSKKLNKLYKKFIFPQLKMLYGERAGCESY